MYQFSLLYSNLVSTAIHIISNMEEVSEDKEDISEDKIEDNGVERCDEEDNFDTTLARSNN